MEKLFYFLILVLIFSSCDEDTVEPVQLGDASSIDVVLDAHRFNSFKNNRNSDPFEIRDIIREGDLIKLTVQYSGGCEPHNFQILWNQKFDKLENGEYGFNMTDLIIHHNANGDLCEAALTDTLYISLNDLDNDIDWDDYAVRFQNGSREQDVCRFLFNGTGLGKCGVPVRGRNGKSCLWGRVTGQRVVQIC